MLYGASSIAMDLVNWMTAPFAALYEGDQPRSEEGVHTANIDNLSSLMTHHRLGGKLREKENCIELGLDYIVPILRLLVQNTAAQRHVTGIIDQDADATKFVRDPAKRWLQCDTMG